MPSSPQPRYRAPGQARPPRGALVARGVTSPGDASRASSTRGFAATRAPAGPSRGRRTRSGGSRTRSSAASASACSAIYDVDGVTTAALLTSFLRACGASVEPAVASREAGYGFTAAAAADFAARGCTLVITGDCGTSDLDAIYAGAALGIEVIVIDHHTVPAAGREHPAKVLVNPFRADSSFPFRGMASVGLAFYVAASVRTELRERGWFRTFGRRGPEPDVRELLDLVVALGTIADLVPLAAEESRSLTSLGAEAAAGAPRGRVSRRCSRRRACRSIARSTRRACRGSSRRGSTRRDGSARRSRRCASCSRGRKRPRRTPRRRSRTGTRSGARSRRSCSARRSRSSARPAIRERAVVVAGVRAGHPGVVEHRRGEARRSCISGRRS